MKNREQYLEHKHKTQRKMKHLIIITLFMLTSMLGFSQGWTYVSGSQLYNFNSKVYLPFSNGNNYIRAASVSNHTFFDSQQHVGIGHQSAVTNHAFSVNGKSFFSGDVRVGNASIFSAAPSATLHVLGNGASFLLEGTDHSYMTFYPDGLGAGRKGYFGYYTSTDNHITLKNEISGGDVEISTTGGGDINLVGSVWAEEIVVQLTNPWPDYVFGQDYKLQTLSDVEKFIEENNHLPNVPSAEEIVKEGVNLGEMDAILLKKIEELTLYTIEQQRLIEKQGKIIEQLLKVKK